MKNLLILIVAVAVFLHFYPQPELEDWYQKQKAMVLETFGEATSTKVRLSADRVYKDIEKQFNTFRDSERNYIQSVTSSRTGIKTYYAEFCQSTNKRDNKLHPANQKKVCTIMAGYSKYF